jgi:DNA-binding response OmpR family regulator
MRRICEHARIQVTEATSTSLALSALKSVSPHLVLVHLELPRAELRHFLQRKKSIYTLCDVPFVLMGFSETLKEVQPGEFGREPPAGWLTLPLDQKAVLATIRRILRERKPEVAALPTDSPEGVFLHAELPARMGFANEGGFVFSSKIRFETDAELNGTLHFPFLDVTDLGKALWVSGDQDAFGEEHETRVSLLGVTRAMAERIRRALGRRR